MAKRKRKLSDEMQRFDSKEFNVEGYTPFSDIDESLIRALEEAEAQALAPAQDGTLTVGRFRLTSVGIELPDEISEEEADQLGNFLVQVDDSRQWWLGDWANSYIPADANNNQIGEIYAGLAERFDIESNTLKNYAYVCRHIPSSIRIDDLSFTHHRLVVGREDAGELLAWAVENGASVKALREHIKAVDSPPTAKAVGYARGEQERPAPPGAVGRIPQEPAQIEGVNAFADSAPTAKAIDYEDADPAPRRVRMGNGVEATVIDEKDGWLMVEMPGGSRNAVHENDVTDITPSPVIFDEAVLPHRFLALVSELLAFVIAEKGREGIQEMNDQNAKYALYQASQLRSERFEGMTQAQRDKTMSEALGALSYALDQAEMYAESITAKASQDER